MRLKNKTAWFFFVSNALILFCLYQFLSSRYTMTYVVRSDSDDIQEKLTNVTKVSPDATEDGINRFISCKRCSTEDLAHCVCSNYSANATLVDGRSCPHLQRTLLGDEPVNHTVPDYRELEAEFSFLEKGGHWSPTNCSQPLTVAVIIPYRDRTVHLKQLLHNLIPKLHRQKLSFTIYVIEQMHGSGFNRGMMRNVGFAEARKDQKYDCYVFNDVDTLIENDENLYTCYSDGPLHMAVAVDRFDYVLKYWNLVGGIISFNENIFRKINGYTNMLFQWGGEDDNLRKRLYKEKIPLFRPNFNTTRITTFRHSQERNPARGPMKLDRIIRRYKEDGINDLRYTVVKKLRTKLFTLVNVRPDTQYYKAKFMIL